MIITTPTPGSMGALLTDVTTVSGSLLSIAGEAVDFIVANPLMLVFFSIAIVGSGIGLFQRLRG